MSIQVQILHNIVDRYTRQRYLQHPHEYLVLMLAGVDGTKKYHSLGFLNQPYFFFKLKQREIIFFCSSQILLIKPKGSGYSYGLALHFCLRLHA